MMMKKILLLTIVCMAFLAVLAGGAWGDDYCVYPGGSGLHDLQNALYDADGNGSDDVIKVVQGKYEGPFNFDSSEDYDITLVGGYTVDCGEKVADPSLTILDGLVTDRTLYIYNYFGGDITVEGFTVRDGSTTYAGGGIYARAFNATGDSGDVTIKHNIIMRNSATWDGGGVYAQSATNSSGATGGVVRLINNIVVENQAGEYGGGVWAQSYSLSGTAGSVIMTNNTITANYAGVEGGGVSVRLYYSGGTIDVYNNIIWGNTAGSSSDDILVGKGTTGTANSYNNDIGVLSGSSNGWNSNVSPLSVDPQFIDAAHLDFRLQSGSLCKEAGDGSAPDIPATDFEGDTRIIGTVDIGADEVSIVTTCVSDAEGLQDALDDAEISGMGDVIMVQEGTYARTGNFAYNSGEGYSITLLGGYDSGCASRAIDPAGTVLQGDGTGTVLSLYDSGGGDILADGFTIQGGDSSLEGGGVSALSAALSGAAGDITLVNNIVTDNSSDDVGGGVSALSAASSGAAGDITLVNNIVTGNTAVNDAGGVYAVSYSISGAAGIVTCTNNTVTGNDAGDEGGGVYLSISGSPGGIVYAYNNIVWGNTATTGGDGYLSKGSGDAYGDNNDFVTGQMAGDPWDGGGTSNINLDPLFVNAGAGNYHLRPNSPCIDAGTNDAPALPPTDFEDDQRMIDGDNDDIPFADIGADEAIVLFAEKAYRLCPDGLGFGSVEEGSTRNLNLVMNNTTDADIDVSSVTTPSSPFDQTADNCGGTTLHPGDTCSITIQFAPSSTGTFYGSFDITTDDPEAGIITVALAGMGISPPPPAPEGSFEQRGSSVSGPGASVVIPDVSVMGTAEVTPVSPPVIEGPTSTPSSTVTTPVVTPESPSVDTGTTNSSVSPLVISSLPPDSLRGQQLLIEEAHEACDSMVFGEINVGTSDQLRITFSHEDGAAIHMGDIIIPSDPYLIVEDTCSGTLLDAGVGCTVTVQFAPPTANTFYDYFLIPTNDPEVGILRINLEGMGVSE